MSGDGVEHGRVPLAAPAAAPLHRGEVLGLAGESHADEVAALSRAMHSGSPQVRPLPRQTRPHEQWAARLASHASRSPSTIEPSGCVTL
jgi:hypothetical protein